MGISKYNSEGYYDPVVYEALTRIEAEERAARAARGQGGSRVPPFGLYLFSLRGRCGEEYVPGKGIFQVRSGETLHPDCPAPSLPAVPG